MTKMMYHQSTTAHPKQTACLIWYDL